MGEEAADAALKEQAEAFRTGMEAERAKRQALEREMAELKGEVKALSTKPAEAKKEITRSELARLVEDGKLTQSEADQLWDEQQAEVIKKTVQDAVTSTVGQQTKAQRVQAGLDSYRSVLPDLDVQGSEARSKVEAEYGYLVNTLGYPKSAETELAALRAAFGPAERLRTGRTERETAQEVGSDGGGEPPTDDKAPKGLSAANRRYYEEQIERGLYKDWDHVKKILNKASPGVKQRLGIG